MVLILLCLGPPACAADRIDLRVLYAGSPGSERFQDFQAFLEEHFAQVAVTDTSIFREEESARHDVVIFDWRETFDPQNGWIVAEKRLQNPPRLSERFDRPAVLIGETGGRVVVNLKLKLDWLCLCLDDAGLDLASDHELFHKPLKVAPEFELVDTPEEYPELSLEPLGSRMRVWKAQTKNWPDIDPGMVHTLYGFTDSPDCELFARGMCMKGPDSVALGRQANLFHWGFSAKPTDMTPSARRLFVNAICYIRKFNGTKPLVKNVARGREWALRYVRAPLLLTDANFDAVERRFRQQIARSPGMIPQQYKGDANQYVEDHLKNLRKAEEAFFNSSVPAELRSQFGNDVAEYTTYYRTNFEYLRPAGGEGREFQFVVDEDVKSLGVSNRKIELLERCVSLLEAHDRPELALRILKRYTQETFESASPWREWLRMHRDRLFFSDVGGYKFFVADSPLPATRPDRQPDSAKN